MRLQKRFDAVADGTVVVMQVWAMRWVAETKIPHLRRVAMSHESFEASHVRPAGATGRSRYERVKQLYRDVDVMLVLTEADARRWAAEGMPDVRAMPNPLPSWPERTSPLDAPVVAAVGRLEPEKRYDLLVEAWRGVHRRHPDWELRIYGDGSLRDQLQEQIDAAGLRDSARLMGPSDDVESALLDASVLALSSDQEGLPLALVEAMSAGVPCVAADCSPGIREIVTDGEDGLVVPTRDPAALAEALCRLIDDSDLRHAAGAAARRSVARFRLPEILDRWERLLDELES
jgi:glycosyltransferase involved in cell wall biosynthesis